MLGSTILDSGEEARKHPRRSKSKHQTVVFSKLPLSLKKQFMHLLTTNDVDFSKQDDGKFMVANLEIAEQSSFRKETKKQKIDDFLRRNEERVNRSLNKQGVKDREESWMKIRRKNNKKAKKARLEDRRESDLLKSMKMKAMKDFYFDKETGEWRKIPTPNDIKEALMSTPDTKLSLEILRKKYKQKRKDKDLSEYNAHEVSLYQKSKYDKKHYYQVLEKKLSMERLDHIRSDSNFIEYGQPDKENQNSDNAGVKNLRKRHRRGKFITGNGEKGRRSFSGIFQSKKSSAAGTSQGGSSYTPSLSIAQINTEAIDDRLLEREKMRVMRELEDKRAEQLRGAKDLERLVLEELNKENMRRRKKRRRRSDTSDVGGEKKFREDDVLQKKKDEFRELVGAPSELSESKSRSMKHLDGTASPNPVIFVRSPTQELVAGNDQGGSQDGSNYALVSRSELSGYKGGARSSYGGSMVSAGKQGSRSQNLQLIKKNRSRAELDTFKSRGKQLSESNLHKERSQDYQSTDYRLKQASSLVSTQGQHQNGQRHNHPSQNLGSINLMRLSHKQQQSQQQPQPQRRVPRAGSIIYESANPGAEKNSIETVLLKNRFQTNNTTEDQTAENSKSKRDRQLGEIKVMQLHQQQQQHQHHSEVDHHSSTAQNLLQQGSQTSGRHTGLLQGSLNTFGAGSIEHDFLTRQSVENIVKPHKVFESPETKIVVYKQSENGKTIEHSESSYPINSPERQLQEALRLCKNDPQNNLGQMIVEEYYKQSRPSESESDGLNALDKAKMMEIMEGGAEANLYPLDTLDDQGRGLRGLGEESRLTTNSKLLQNRGIEKELNQVADAAENFFRNSLTLVAPPHDKGTSSSAEDYKSRPQEGQGEVDRELYNLYQPSFQKTSSDDTSSHTNMNTHNQPLTNNSESQKTDPNVMKENPSGQDYSRPSGLTDDFQRGDSSGNTENFQEFIHQMGLDIRHLPEFLINNKQNPAAILKLKSDRGKNRRFKLPSHAQRRAMLRKERSRSPNKHSGSKKKMLSPLCLMTPKRLYKFKNMIPEENKTKYVIGLDQLHTDELLQYYQDVVNKSKRDYVEHQRFQTAKKLKGIYMID